MDGDRPYLNQVSDKTIEGSPSPTKSIVYEVQRATVAAGGAVIFRTRERGEFWRVAVLRDPSVPAGTPCNCLVQQGEHMYLDSAIELASGGVVRFPASSSSLQVQNIGTAAASVVVIAVAGARDDYLPGGYD